MGFGCVASLLQWILIKGRLNMLLACSEAKLYRTLVTPAVTAELNMTAGDNGLQMGTRARKVGFWKCVCVSMCVHVYMQLNIAS